MAFKLKAEPTFKAKVGIPIPGSEPSMVEFEFKHRTVDELAQFREDCKKGLSNRQVFDAIVVGWGLTDPFSTENTELLLQNYPGSAAAISKAYMDELTAARRGN